ncbi:MAG: S-layer homology domain-containing protein, partial [Butyricicoccus sp.]|nr:S-layer homology domain-containing protein [Butyricicoccus sp.]
LAVMLWRTVGCPLGAGDLSAFTDASSISDYAVTAMQWAIETGLMTGNGSGTLAPKAGATRAETAAMLMRFCEANQ